MSAVVLVAIGLTVASWIAAVAILARPSTDVASEVSEDDTADSGGS